MTIDIDPVAFAVGGFAVRWYGLIAAAAAATAFVLVRRAARRAGLSDAPVWDGAVWVGVAAAAVVGGRVLFLVQNELPEQLYEAAALRFRVPRLAAAPLAGRLALPRPP